MIKPRLDKHKKRKFRMNFVIERIENRVSAVDKSFERQEKENKNACHYIFRGLYETRVG